MASATPPAEDRTGNGIGEPAVNMVAVTPSDTVDLQFVSRALLVNGAGDLRIQTLGGQDVTISTVAAGATIVVRATRVYSTSTTATLIYAMA